MTGDLLLTVNAGGKFNAPGLPAHTNLAENPKVAVGHHFTTAPRGDESGTEIISVRAKQSRSKRLRLVGRVRTSTVKLHRRPKALKLLMTPRSVFAPYSAHPTEYPRH